MKNTPPEKSRQRAVGNKQKVFSEYIFSSFLIFLSSFFLFSLSFAQNKDTSFSRFIKRFDIELTLQSYLTQSGDFYIHTQPFNPNTPYTPLYKSTSGNILGGLGIDIKYRFTENCDLSLGFLFNGEDFYYETYQGYENDTYTGNIPVNFTIRGGIQLVYNKFPIKFHYTERNQV